MPKALLTGAHGFLGKYIHRHLSLQYSVDTLGVNPSSDIVCDLSAETPALTNAYDYVIHAAALAHQMHALPDEKYFAINTSGTRRICDAISKTGSYPKRFVFISTVAVYGLNEGVLINEDAPLNGVSAYAKSKIAAETIVQEWCSMHKVPCTILRVPLIAAMDAPGNFGAMVRSINNHRFLIPGNGAAKKSMVRAEDIALLIAAEKLQDGIYNLTDGHHPSLKEIANSIAGKLGKHSPKHLPGFFAKTLSLVGDYIPRFPFNSRVLRQLQSTLTFDDTRARNAFQWNPEKVIEEL